MYVFNCDCQIIICLLFMIILYISTIKTYQPSFKLNNNVDFDVVFVLVGRVALLSHNNKTLKNNTDFAIIMANKLTIDTFPCGIRNPTDFDSRVTPR